MPSRVARWRGSPGKHWRRAQESRIVARRGGKVAGDARRAIEADTGRPAVTAQNAAQLNAVVTDVIQGVAEADKPNEDEK